MKPSCRKGRDEHSIELPKREDDGTWYIYHDLSMMIVNRDGYSFFFPQRGIFHSSVYNPSSIQMGFLIDHDDCIRNFPIHVAIGCGVSW